MTEPSVTPAAVDRAALLVGTPETTSGAPGPAFDPLAADHAAGPESRIRAEGSADVIVPALPSRLSTGERRATSPVGGLPDGRAGAEPPSAATPRDYIGSADAAMVADLSPWGSPLTVFNRLSGLVAEERAPSLRMWLGERMEPILLDLFAARTGRRPARLAGPDDPPFVHPDHPFIGAHPDFDRLEVKTTRSDREWGEDGMTATLDAMVVPLHYFLQVQHQMAVMGWDVMDVAVLIGHDRFNTYTVPRDDGVVAALIGAEVELWGQVQAGLLPSGHDPESRRAYLRARFPREARELRPATPEEALVAEAWRLARDARIEAEASEDERADALKAIIGDSAGLLGLASWKHQEAVRTVGVPALAEVLREAGRLDLLSALTQRSGSRVLRELRRKEAD